jgi:hypothetical protein
MLTHKHKHTLLKKKSNPTCEVRGGQLGSLPFGTHDDCYFIRSALFGENPYQSSAIFPSFFGVAVWDQVLRLAPPKWSTVASWDPFGRTTGASNILQYPDPADLASIYDL